jgi:hypothetical protein
MEKKYEEWVQEYQEGKITLVDFINGQPGLDEEYYSFLQKNGLSDCEQSAKLFIAKFEDEVMNAQKSIL